MGRVFLIAGVLIVKFCTVLIELGFEYVALFNGAMRDGGGLLNEELVSSVLGGVVPDIRLLLDVRGGVHNLGSSSLYLEGGLLCFFEDGCTINKLGAFGGTITFVVADPCLWVS